MPLEAFYVCHGSVAEADGDTVMLSRDAQIIIDATRLEVMSQLQFMLCAERYQLEAAQHPGGRVHWREKDKIVAEKRNERRLACVVVGVSFRRGGPGPCDAGVGTAGILY